ncbi:hypothetical protein FC89_GL002300 [Liquorilactobacillus ghanensis DSM 18630]|uniref:Integral membrane protein n=1 Tax=Liquorilactobacillus ghanensis DSM 18630 TaxID=1423750 RepID=A0A0R1VGP0_9LACO|nr:hypothetical protein [Liquorilactobacillus ghanensis]KRM04609.1 hypothetical protein FC89_GL002300 [Liquorilactobacillus ghanensis DSM 18630]
MKSLWGLFNVLFGIAFVVLAIQFFSGKWLKLLAGSANATSRQLISAGRVISPALFILGISVFLLGFPENKLFVKIGNIGFVIAIGYIIVMVLITMFQSSR